MKWYTLYFQRLPTYVYRFINNVRLCDYIQPRLVGCTLLIVANRVYISGRYVSWCIFILVDQKVQIKYIQHVDTIR